MADENLLSKVKIGSTIYDLKDADSRTKLTTLIGTNELKALGTAAWRAVAAQISDGDGKIADAATVKAYVDAQIGSIKTFDVVVCEAVAAKIPAGAEYRDGETVIIGTMAASAETMKKLYMVKNSKSGAGSYMEWISIDKGEGVSPRYVWECIGSTEVDLSNYVQKTQKIAGLALSGDISTADLQNALGLKQLAYKDKADVVASYNGASITGVTTAKYTPEGSITLNDLTQTSTAADLTKADYTPAGSVNVTAADNGAVVTGGSINVTVKDAASGTAITDLTYDNYTPAGTIAATSAGSFSALKSATFGEDSTNGVQIEGTISKPAINVNDDSTDTFVKSLKAGNVDAASIDTTKFSGGSFTGATQASFTQGAKASFTQGAKAALSTANISYVEEGVKIAIDTQDAEMLVFTNVTAKSAKAVDTFTANGDDQFTANGDDTFNTNNVGTFTAASLSEGFFSAQKLPVVDGTAAAVTSVSAELAEAPAFTGKKYKVATTDDTALKEVAFTGTAAAIKLSGAKYLKQEIDAKTFTPTKGDLSFAGTEVKNFQVTGVNYDKATANGASFSGASEEIAVNTITVPSAKLNIEDKA